MARLSRVPPAIPLGTVSAKGNIGHPLRWFELLSCASPASRDKRGKRTERRSKDHREAGSGLNRSEEPFTMHAIRKLRESGHATVADYEKLLAPNVVFHSPVLIRTAEGRAVVAKIFATSTTLREGAYTGEWKLDDRRTLLRWKGTIQGHELESSILSKKTTRD
jgi:hypothetical protein